MIEPIIIPGDCLDMLPLLNECSVDAIVTDPPYDLTANKRGGSGEASVNLDSPYGRSRIGTGNGAGGFMGKQWDSTGIAFDPAVWQECLRVLKPGGHLLAFGGTRTWHRMVVAIEDAGFELRDSIAWLYGSGFPKSLDVSKAIDKAAGAEREVLTQGAPVKRMIPGADQDRTGSWIKDNGREFVPTITAPATDDAQRWSGWGTALKPAHEPIVVARKPLIGTVAANVLAHGTGALNIDGCRIGDEVRVNPPGSTNPRVAMGDGWRSDAQPTIATGRWPANVVLDESQAAELDQQSGVLHSQNPATRASRSTRQGVTEMGTGASIEYGDTGGASRFFYCAKAPKKERPTAAGASHPTVKPLSLMRWLVRLVTPPGGTVLDPFLGSGTTAEACLLEGFRCIGIEREPAYLDLIKLRLSRRTA